MYQRDNRSFEEKLAIGQEKEDMLIDMLNWSGFKARRNNTEVVTDVDIELLEDSIYIDAKYMGTPFYKAYQNTGIHPENCLTMQIRHINSYYQKEHQTGKEVWVACFIDYSDYDIYELVFFQNAKLKKLADKSGSNQKLHFNRKDGVSFKFFLNYLEMQRELRS